MQLFYHKLETTSDCCFYLTATIIIGRVFRFVTITIIAKLCCTKFSMLTKSKHFSVSKVITESALLPWLFSLNTWCVVEYFYYLTL